MNRYYSLEYNTDAIPPNDTIHCHTYWCRTQVASFNDYIPMTLQSQSGVLGLFNWVFNVHVADNLSYRLSESRIVVANTYCRQCGTMIGWKFITVQEPDRYVREGRFCMRLDKLTFSNHIPLLRSIEERNFQANEGNADQDGDSTDQDEDSTDQDGDSTVQDEDTADQDLGINEQNVDQDGDANEHVPNEQEVGTNEQNADQDGGVNEQNHDQNGGAPMN